MITFIPMFLVVGVLAGAVAGLIVEGHDFGVFRDIAIGVVGAFIGGAILPTLGAIYGFWGLLAMATLGAVVLLVAERIVHMMIAPRKKATS